MKRKRILERTALLGCAVLLAAGPAAGSPPETDPPAVTVSNLPGPSASLLQSGLLDFSRVDVSHSLSYGFSSTGAGTYSGGLWVTEIGYRLSDPLRVSMDIGAVLDTDGGPLLDARNVYLRGFNLDYRASRSFRIHVSYLNQPPNAGPGHPFPGGSLGYRPWNSLLGPDR